MMLPEQSMMGGPPMMGSPPEEPAAAPADIIREMLELADSYRRVEQDDEDLLAMEQARTLLQKLLAAQQRQLDGLQQGKAEPAALRRFG
jgi:hypothetical protein